MASKSTQTPKGPHYGFGEEWDFEEHRYPARPGHQEISSQSFGHRGTALKKFGKPYNQLTPEQKLLTHAQACIDLWSTSAAHWGAVTSYHREYCYSMSLGRDGHYYCNGLFN